MMRGVILALGVLLCMPSLAEDKARLNVALETGTEVGNGKKIYERISLPVEAAEWMLVEHSYEGLKLVISPDYGRAWLVQERSNGSSFASEPFVGDDPVGRLISAASLGLRPVETLRVPSRPKTAR